MIKDRFLWILLIALGIVVVLLVLWLALQAPVETLSGDGLPSFVYGIALLVFLVAGVVAHRHIRPGKILTSLAIWLALIVALVLGYGYRHEAAAIGNRLIAELMPSRGAVLDGGEVIFRERRGGHFVVDAEVNGVTVRFLVDTGASDVTLTPRDARRLGFDLQGLSFHRTYRTANGTVRGAPVRLGNVEIGPISLQNVRATVNAADMDLSLLGMSFLSRLSSYEVASGTLTLRP